MRQVPVAATLAAQLGWDLQEGDELHPTANVEKMRLGSALDDQDRGPWLDRVAQWIRSRTTAGQAGIITCSALKLAYRDRLRGEHVVFVHLSGNRDTISQRLGKRADHFMPGSLLDSQMSTLEATKADEAVLVVDIDKRPTEIAVESIQKLHLEPAGRMSTD